MQTVTEDDIVVIMPKRKRGRPKRADAPPPPKRRNADSETRMRKARVLVVRGTPRAVILRKLKLTAEEATALESWARGRK